MKVVIVKTEAWPVFYIDAKPTEGDIENNLCVEISQELYDEYLKAEEIRKNIHSKLRKLYQDNYVR